MAKKKTVNKTEYKTSVYRVPVPEAEIKGLEARSEHTTRFLRDLLPEDMNGMKVLDAGAGPHGLLGNLVEERGGSYVAMDIREGHLLSQKQKYVDRRLVGGDVLSLPFGDANGDEKPFDVAVASLVLMNLPPNQRERVLKELSRVAKKVIVVDYDWNKGLTEPNHLVEKGAELVRWFGAKAGIELDFGSKLKLLVEQVFGDGYQINEQTHHDPPADHYEDWLLTVERILPGLGMLVKKGVISEKEAERKKKEILELTLRLGRLLQELQSKNKLDETAKFSLPNLVAVTILKKGKLQQPRSE